MAKRPAWSSKNGYVMCEDFEFEWSGGFALIQKQKNIKALHESIYNAKGENALEISTKGLDSLGKSMSAFLLKLDEVPLENVFQASKKYKKGGPFLDLLNVLPKEAKRDERHQSSGELMAFVRNDEIWALEPATAFYDYIYVTALIQNKGYRVDLSAYEWFTDIEFNPKKSINCQARAVAIYKLLQKEDLFEVMKNQDTWIEFHKKRVVYRKQ